MIRFMLDTDICIMMIRGRADQLVRRLRRRRAGSVGISIVTLAELQYGVAKSSDPPRNLIALAYFCASLQVLPFDEEAAMEYGQLRAALSIAGTPIGPLDTLIAAHAKSVPATVVTNNEREFRRVADLKVENWLT